jgi:hypothetical protein
MARVPAEFPDFFELIRDRIYEETEGREEPLVAADEAGATLQPQPAPWLGPDPLPFTDEDAATTLIELASDAADLLDPQAIELVPDPDLLGFWLHPKTANRRLRLPADAIAVYRPWHLNGEDWGIYVSELALTVFTAGLAQLTGGSIPQLAPLALRQILEHEWTHFAFEVAGTEIGDALSAIVYPSYVTERFNASNRPYVGPLEEVVASWSEVDFARNPPHGFRSLRPRGYTRAVQHLLSLAPPGYRDWRQMDSRLDGAAIVAGVASLIAGRDMSTSRWGAVTDAEKAQVPIYWVGEPSRAAAFGALPKSIGPPTIRRLEQWLKHIGATPAAARRGKGSHRRWMLPNQEPIGYATSAGFLLPNEARNIAFALGITRNELFERIAQMTVPSIPPPRPPQPQTPRARRAQRARR